MTPLRQRMLEDMGIRNLAENTQSPTSSRSVVRQILRPLAGSSAPKEIRAYQVYLTTDTHALAEQCQRRDCALRFLYKVTLKRPWASERFRCPSGPSSSR